MALSGGGRRRSEARGTNPLRARATVVAAYFLNRNFTAGDVCSLSNSTNIERQVFA